jgi:hypothetical protein
MTDKNEVWYLARWCYRPEVSIVSIERSTESSVWINGRRHARCSGYESFFETFDDAKAHLIGRARGELSALQRRLYTARNKLREAEQIKEPSP